MSSRVKVGLDCDVLAGIIVGYLKACKVPSNPEPWREREFFTDNLLVRIHLIIEMILSQTLNPQPRASSSGTARPARCLRIPNSRERVLY
jgi:hypothetical protein